jgi:hypothetical protein
METRVSEKMQRKCTRGRRRPDDARAFVTPAST